MKRLSIEERMLIQACLCKDMNLTEIAIRLDRNKSTVSREINAHLVVKDGYHNKPCSHRKEHILCNSCPYKGRCGYEKHYYNFEEADRTKDIQIIDEVLLEQVRQLKQSLHHAYVSNPYDRKEK